MTKKSCDITDDETDVKQLWGEVFYNSSEGRESSQHFQRNIPVNGSLINCIRSAFSEFFVLPSEIQSNLKRYFKINPILLSHQIQNREHRTVTIICVIVKDLL